MRVVNAILCIILVLFAVVQYNDPDAVYWGVIYGIGAVWTGLAAFRPRLFSRQVVVALFSVTLAAALIGVIVYWPKTPQWWMQDVWWETETAREGMGMMIVAFALLMASFVVFRVRRTAS